VIVRGVREFEGLRVLTDDWPVVVMEFPERVVSDSALESCLLHIEKLLSAAKEGGEKTYTITDLSRMYQIAPASQRKYVADWVSRTLLLQKAASIGGANVTPSTILRGIITAINWISPPPFPSVFVATRREAFAEAIKAFDAAHAPLPAAVRASFAKR
jgi:hypothetical protein